MDSEGAGDGLGACDCACDFGWKNPHIMSALLLRKVSVKYHIIRFQMYSPLLDHRIILLLPMSFEVMVTLCLLGSLVVSKVPVALGLLPLL